MFEIINIFHSRDGKWTICEGEPTKSSEDGKTVIRVPRKFFTSEVAEKLDIQVGDYIAD